MRCVGHSICVGETRNAYIILVGNLKGSDRLGDLSVGGRIILNWILKWGMRMWNGFIGTSGELL
jgi:hypothetical protein